MDGMTRGKRVARFAGQWHAVQMAPHGEAIGPFLIKRCFEDVRQEGRRKRNEQHVIACSPLLGRTIAAPNPPARGQAGEHMLIGTPSDDLGSLLGGRIGVSRDGTGDRDIGSGRFDNRNGTSPKVKPSHNA
jgi:hypothetical protein